MKFKNPDGPLVKTKPASKAKGKKRKNDADGEEGEDNVVGGAPELLLANKWDLEHGIDPTGWWISEKLDGVRYVTTFL
jgi:DNA ligase-1